MAWRPAEDRGLDMRYWRDPDTMDVIKANADAPSDPGDVVVVPSSTWARLAELLDDEPLDTADKWLDRKAHV